MPELRSDSTISGHYRDQGLGAETHCPGEPAVLMGARQREGWEEQ